MEDWLFDDIAALADSSGLQDQLPNDGTPIVDSHVFPDIEDAVATSLQTEDVPPAKRLKSETEPSIATPQELTNSNGIKSEPGKLWQSGEGHNGNTGSTECVEQLQQWLNAETSMTRIVNESAPIRPPDQGLKAEVSESSSVKTETAEGNNKSEEKDDKKEDAEDDGGEGEAGKKRKRKAAINSTNTRKNIRDILTDDKLESETLAAQQAEIERKRRLQEIQQRAHQEMLAQQMFLKQQEQHQIATGLLRKGMYPPLGPGVRVPSYSVMKSEHQPLNLMRNDDIIIVESSSNTSSDSDSNGYIPKAKLGVIAISSSEDDSSSSDSDDSDDDDDDDVVAVSSNPSEEEETKDEDPHNSGSHVNDNFNQPDAQGRILVNVGHPVDDPDIFLAPHLSKVVKPHQVGGIRFLYDNIIESLSSFKTSNGFGCILAHSMGLGKTLQVISFVDVFLRHTGARTVLIIVPINTIQNWVSEFNMWIPSQPPNANNLINEQPSPGGSNFDGREGPEDPPKVRHRTFKVTALGDAHKTNPLRAKAIRDWVTDGGVLLMGYELFRIILSKKNNNTKFKRGRKPAAVPLNKPLRHPMDLEEEERNQELIAEMQQNLQKPDLVICDEGHRIKNCHASTSQALKNIKTKRRVVLTGYPLQNNLIEYWCMVDFVRPNFLGTRTEFCNMFERPIQNGQCIDSTPEDIRLMRYRAHVLHSLLEGFVQRRGHSVLRTCLPQKYEHVILVRLTKIQRLLYDTFMQELTDRNAITNPIKAFSVCCKIWNHPDILFNCIKNLQTKGLEDDLDLEEAKLGSSVSNITKPRKRASHKSLMGQASHSRNNAPMGIGIPVPPTTMLGNAGDHAMASLEAEMGFLPFREKSEPNIIPHEWALSCLKDYMPGLVENGLKMVLAMHIIEQALLAGDRLLLFSQSLFTLNLIEEFLGKLPVPYSNGCKWAKNKNYFRLDGSTSSVDREKFVNEFNSNPNILLFLISTRAGSLGINLIGANRVIVFDASWNPCHDTQAVCRIYRYGQSKACHVYRLVTDNTLEKKIYDRQINKQGMSDRVVDELSPDVTLTMKEVSNLLCLNEKDAPEQDFTGHADEYEDHVLSYICLRLGHCLTRQPFEHDSQLVDRKELKLTKTEKRLAKQSYEMDKRQTNHFGGRSTSCYGYSRSEPFSQMDGSYSGRPVANVRPMLSTAPRPSPLDILAKQGVTFRQIHLTKEVCIPPPDGKGEPIVIPVGQQVMIISSPRGIFLRCPNNKLVQISHPSAMGRSGGMNSEYRMIQNRFANSSISCTPIRSKEAEVINLSDDDDEVIVTASSAPSYPSSRSVIVSPGSTYTSQNPGLLTGGMLVRTEPMMQQPSNTAPPTSTAPSTATTSRSTAAYVRPLMSPSATNPTNSIGGGLPGAFNETNSINLSQLFPRPKSNNISASSTVPTSVSNTPMMPPSSSSHQSSSTVTSNSELPTSAMDYLNKTLSTPSYNNYPPWGSGPSTWGSGGSYHQGQSSAADQVAFVSSIRDLLLPSAPSGPRLFPASTTLPDLVTAPLSAQHLGALYPHVLDVANDTPSYQGNPTPTPSFNSH